MAGAAATISWPRCVAQLRPGDGAGGRRRAAGAASTSTGVRAAGFDAVGLDLCRRHRRRRLVGDASRLPLPDDSAGAALALHMLYHLPDPADGLRELARITRPGRHGRRAHATGSTTCSRTGTW